MFLSYVAILFLALASVLIGPVRPLAFPGGRWLRAMVLLQFAAEALNLGLALNGVPNHAVYWVYAPLEFALLLLIGTAGIGGHRWRWMMVAAVPYYTLYLMDVIGGRGMLNAYSLTCASFVLVPFFMRALMQVALHDERPLFRSADTWVHLALLTYLGGIVPSVASFNYLMERDEAQADRIVTVIQMLFVLRSMFTAVGCSLLRWGPATAAHVPSMNARTNPIDHG
jgi:hypothetical protein